MRLKLARISHTMMMNGTKVINFAAGPSKLPEKVLEKAAKEMCNYKNTGHSVMEMSHRSSDFGDILHKTVDLVKSLLKVPVNYHVLLMQGGGTTQFSAVPLNLMQRGRSVDYIVSGSWSAKAAKEAEKFGRVNKVVPKVEAHTGVPCTSTWDPFDPEAAYVYYCDNETIHGIEFPFVPETHGIPLVCDMSSNFLSRPVDVSKFGMIFAGAQKNIGCAGVTVVIIRDDLIGHAMSHCPTMLDYKTYVAHKSLYNTPPTYSIYIMGLVLEWIRDHGGVEVMARRAQAKSEMLYNAIDQSNDFYVCPIEEKFRSCMNITFRIGSMQGDEELEKKFLDDASKLGMKQLKGHRSVGGIRVSCYNAIHIEEVEVLVNYMAEFYEQHSSTPKVQSQTL